MKRILFVLALLPGSAFADKDIHKKSETIDCGKDPIVAITASEGTYTLTGTCAKIAITGGQNKVTIENVKKLALNGSGNTVDVVAAEKIGIIGDANIVSWKKGLGQAKPTIGTVGTNNKITQAK